jgi:hypothetical protein
MTRQDFLDEVQAHLAKGRHVLLTGRRGLGKSHLLGTVAQAHADAVFIRSLGAKKQTLLTVLRHSFDAGHLDDFAYFVDWRDVQKKLRYCTIAELKALIAGALTVHRYLIVLDNLDRVTERGLLDIVLPLMEAAQFLAAADTSTPTKARRVALVVDKLKALEVPPLTADETRALLWATLDRDRYPHWQVIEAKVLAQAAGKPGVVVDLARQLSGSTGSLAEIRDLAHTGAPRVNVAFPLAMALIAAVFAGRYLARGLDDPTLYVLAGLGSALTYMLRPYVWKMRS